MLTMPTLNRFPGGGGLGAIHGISPDVREPNGSTPLILAAMFDQTSLRTS